MAFVGYDHGYYPLPKYPTPFTSTQSGAVTVRNSSLNGAAEIQAVELQSVDRKKRPQCAKWLCAKCKQDPLVDVKREPT